MDIWVKGPFPSWKSLKTYIFNRDIWYLSNSSHHYHDIIKLLYLVKNDTSSLIKIYWWPNVSTCSGSGYRDRPVTYPKPQAFLETSQPTGYDQPRSELRNSNQLTSGYRWAVLSAAVQTCLTMTTVLWRAAWKFVSMYIDDDSYCRSSSNMKL